MKVRFGNIITVEDTDAKEEDFLRSPIIHRNEYQ